MLRDLGDGLLLRRARAADAKRLTAFNADVLRHQDDPEPAAGIGAWTLARTGADRSDELWEGVLHMTPSPSFRHRTLASHILAFFHDAWCPGTKRAAVMQVNVSTSER